MKCSECGFDAEEFARKLKQLEKYGNLIDGVLKKAEEGQTKLKGD